jgi:hypothetical protein
MTTVSEAPETFTPDTPDILAMLEIATSSQTLAARMITEYFGADGSALHTRGGGTLIPEPTERDGQDAVTSQLPTIQDLKNILSAINTLTAAADHVRTLCAEMILDGSDPFIEKQQRISIQLGEKSPEAAIKKYLLHSPAQLHDTKAVHHSASPNAGCRLGDGPALLPMLQVTVDAGAVTLSQAEVIATVLSPVARRKTGVDPDVLATVESILVGHATGGRYGIAPEDLDPDDVAAGRYGLPMHPEELRHTAKQLAELIDQDGPEPSDDEIHAKRGLTLKPGKKPGDPARLNATLTPEAYELLSVLLASILDPKTGVGPEGSNTGEPNTGAAAADPTEPPLPFTVEHADEGFQFPDEEPITFPQAQHDAFVALLELAAKTAPDQGGAAPRLILLARAEQVLKTLNSQAVESLQALTRAGGNPDQLRDNLLAAGRSMTAGASRKPNATSEVTAQVGTAIDTLIRAGRAGFLTDTAIAGINTLIGLLNTSCFVRTDDATECLKPPPTNAPGPPAPVFGASLLQDPRLLTSALLPATGETIPLSRLARILCTAITEIVTTKGGDFLSYAVTEKRTFTATQRRVLLTTYATCAVPDCHVPGLRCDAHHVRPASKAGPTTVSNGVLLCRHHHTQLHLGGFALHSRQPGVPGLDATPQ